MTFRKFADKTYETRDEYIKDCLANARKIEEEVKTFLETFFPEWGKLKLSEGCDKRGDIYAPRHKTFMEVKHDTTSHKTGNFYLEEDAWNGSKSDIWVFVDNDKYYFIRKKKIAKMLFEFDLKEVMGGDKKQYRGWLIPRGMILAEASVFPRNWQGDTDWYRQYVLRK